MKFRFLLILGFGLPLLLGVSIVSAQQNGDDECPALVEEALEKTADNCDATSTNEVCYGHNDLEADAQGGIDELNLSKPGDREDITRVRAVRLSAMDEVHDLWGVALMQVRALLTRLNTTLPDGRPAQPEDVTFVLFGDVALENAVESVRVTAQRDANVRQSPNTEAQIVSRLVAGQTIEADGRLADSSWLRIRLPNDFGTGGWVSKDVLNPSSATSSLTVLDPAVQQSGLYGSMQAFYLESGVDDAPCSAAPNSGMMIQTTEGAAEVTLLMNEANIQLRATAFVQARPGDEMTLYVLEGSATVESDGVQRTLIPGTSLTVPLDEEGNASGPPSEPEPYDVTQLQALPVSLLPRPVEIPQAASLRNDVPLGGVWNFFWSAPSAPCGSETIEFAVDQPATNITVENDGESFVMLLTRYNRVSQGQYATVFEDATGYLHRYTIIVNAYDRMTGDAHMEHPMFGCQANVSFTLSLVSPSEN